MTDLLDRQPAAAGDASARLAVLRASMGGVLDTVETMDRIAGATAAARAELIDSARLHSLAIAAEGAGISGSGGGDGVLGSEPEGWNSATRARREFVFDIAARLRIPERTAETLIAESERLVHFLRATHTALGAGEISYRHAQVIIDETAGLSEVVTAEFEDLVLPKAKEVTVSKFKQHARKKREALHPETIEKRHRAAVETRGVWVDPQHDGMALLSTLMTAQDAVAAYDRITRIAMADASPDPDGTKRTLAQRRADVVTDLLLDGDTCTLGDPVPHGIRPQVLVTVPVLTLLGQTETPAHLDGYGPISPDTARDLAVRAPSFARILTDPVTSAILDFDRSKYAVPADLKQVVRLQHETCTSPGCNKRAVHCDLDHTQPFGPTRGPDGSTTAGTGTTSLANLAPLCPEHHHLKHHTRVGLTKHPDGTMQWTTATGKIVTVGPTNLLGTDMLDRGSPGGAAPPGSDNPPASEWDDTPEPDGYPF